MAVLSIYGNIPEKKEILKISESWQKISFISSFSIFVVILLGPIDLLESSVKIMLSISFLSVGFRKKEL